MSVVEWSKEEVAKWLKTNGLEEYADNFKSWHVDGPTLMELTEGMIDKLIPGNMRDQIIFMKAQKRLAIPKIPLETLTNKTSPTNMPHGSPSVRKDGHTTQKLASEDQTSSSNDCAAEENRADAVEDIENHVPCRLSSPCGRSRTRLFSTSNLESVLDDKLATPIAVEKSSKVNRSVCPAIPPANLSDSFGDEVVQSCAGTSDSQTDRVSQSVVEPGDEDQVYPQVETNGMVPEEQPCKESTSVSSGKDVAHSSKLKYTDDMKGYSLPAFPPHLRLILESRKTKDDFLPHSSNRRKVIDVIATDLQRKKKMHPSRKGYKNIMDALFDAYSFIGDYDSWKLSLRAKLKALRIPLCSSPEVDYMRQKYGKPGVSGRKRKNIDVPEDDTPRKRPRLPHHEIDEDENTEDIKKLIKDLKDEASSGFPDDKRVQRKLQLTASHRLLRMYEEKTPVEEFLEEYPILRCRIYLVEEVRINHNMTIRGKAAKLLPYLADLVNFVTYKCKKFKVFSADYQDKIEGTLDKVKKEEAGIEFAYKLLPSLFNEDEGLILDETDKGDYVKTGNPVLQCDKKGKFCLYVGQKQVLSSPMNRFSCALEAWFATFWVFGFEFPTKLRKTAQFLEKYIAGHSIKVDRSVQTWAQKLKFVSKD